MFDHEDRLGPLDSSVSLDDKVRTIHAALRERFPFIQRIAAAVFDPETETLKTFLFTGEEDSPLTHYSAKLDDAPSLREIVEKGRPRVVNDLAIFSGGRHEHTRRVGAEGYRASYTMPMYHQGRLFGFIFFNSYDAECFNEETLRQIDPFGHLIALTIINDLTSLHTLLATVKAARVMAHARDGETGSHLDRMSRFARVIAEAVTDLYDELTDEYIEKIFIFSPLHDIGKIAIPDRVLLKPGKLDPDEEALMRTHPIRGRELIDQMLTQFHMGPMQGSDILRNIALFHHEAIDGTGYPHGRAGMDIPIEARIVAVADIFDALTSRRPYKPAWTNDDAFALLRQLAGKKLDENCVNALIDNRETIEAIQQQFQENIMG